MLVFLSHRILGGLEEYLLKAQHIHGKGTEQNADVKHTCWKQTAATANGWEHLFRTQVLTGQENRFSITSTDSCWSSHCRMSEKLKVNSQLVGSWFPALHRHTSSSPRLYLLSSTSPFFPPPSFPLLLWGKSAMWGVPRKKRSLPADIWRWLLWPVQGPPRQSSSCSVSEEERLSSSGGKKLWNIDTFFQVNLNGCSCWIEETSWPELHFQSRIQKKAH